MGANDAREVKACDGVLERLRSKIYAGDSAACSVLLVALVREPALSEWSTRNATPSRCQIWTWLATSRLPAYLQPVQKGEGRQDLHWHCGELISGSSTLKTEKAGVVFRYGRHDRYGEKR